MIEGTPSRTALLAAVSRARHQLLDGGKVFSDPLAVQIVGDVLALESKNGKLNDGGKISRALRGPIAARSRIVEDVLAQAAANGVKQYVLLGAGLDTFANRNPWSSAGLRVFEVDHQDTQRWKLARLNAVGIRREPSAQYIEADLRSNAWVTKLLDAGFDSTQASVFSTMGVSVYLPQPVFAQVVSDVRGLMSNHSSLVFDFVRKPAGFDLRQRTLLSILGRRYARMGEPWCGFYSTEWIEDLAKTLGLSSVEFMQPDYIARHYLSDSPALRPPRSGRSFAAVAVLRA